MSRLPSQRGGLCKEGGFQGGQGTPVAKSQHFSSNLRMDESHLPLFGP